RSLNPSFPAWPASEGPRRAAALRSAGPARPCTAAPGGPPRCETLRSPAPAGLPGSCAPWRPQEAPAAALPPASGSPKAAPRRRGAVPGALPDPLKPEEAATGRRALPRRGAPFAAAPEGGVPRLPALLEPLRPLSAQRPAPAGAPSPASPSTRASERSGMRSAPRACPPRLRRPYQLKEPGERLLKREHLVHFLAEEGVDRRKLLKSCIDQRVVSLDIGAEVDQVFRLPVGGEELPQPAGGGPVLGGDDVHHGPADAGQHVDGRVMRTLRQAAGEDDVPVQDAAHRVGDG